MKVWLNISNLCVRVQYYYDGQIPKWTKANHVFLIGYLAGKMGPLTTRDFQGCLSCTRNTVLFGQLSNLVWSRWLNIGLVLFWFFLTCQPPVLPRDYPGLEVNPLVSGWVMKISRQLTWSVFDLNNSNNNNNNNIKEINFKNTKICWHSENYLLCSVWMLKYTLCTVKWQINW